MKIKLMLVSTLILTSSVTGWFFYQRHQVMNSAPAGGVPVLIDDPATIERVTIDEGPDVTDRIPREVLRPKAQLEAIWSELYKPWGMKIVNDRVYLLDRGQPGGGM
jgi:hypothetical protein